MWDHVDAPQSRCLSIELEGQIRVCVCVGRGSSVAMQIKISKMGGLSGVCQMMRWAVK